MTEKRSIFEEVSGEARPKTTAGVIDSAKKGARGPIRVMLDLPGAGTARIEIIDPAGRMIEERTITPGTSTRATTTLNAQSKWRAGVYWLRATQDGHEAARRFVIAH